VARSVIWWGFTRVRCALVCAGAIRKAPLSDSGSPDRVGPRPLRSRLNLLSRYERRKCFWLDVLPAVVGIETMGGVSIRFAEKTRSRGAKATLRRYATYQTGLRVCMSLQGERETDCQRLPFAGCASE